MIKENNLPMQDLKIFGIYKNGEFTIPEEQVQALQEGKLTDVVELKNLKSKDIHIETLPARLSIVRGTDGKPSLRIDPVYREPHTHPLLSTLEKQQLIRSELANIKKDYVDRDGNVRTEIIEYDKTTRQFMSFDPRAIQAPERVNCQKLMDEQKKKFKEGQVVELEDGTAFQLSSTDKKGIKSNRNALVLSVLLDGGISFLLVTGLKRMLGRKSSEQKTYSEGFKDGLLMVQKKAERNLALNPGDRGAQRELDQVKQEYSKLSVAHPHEIQKMDKDELNRLNSLLTEEDRKPNHNQENDERHQRRI